MRYRAFFVVAIILSLRMSCVFSDAKPAFVFDGRNGYPSESKYRIEVFVGDDGYISEIKSFDASGTSVDHAIFKVSGKTATGRWETTDIETVMEYKIGPTSIKSRVREIENKTKKTLSDRTREFSLGRQADVLFENNRLRFIKSPYYDLVIYDKEHNESSYKFYRNTAFVEGWYKSDWLTSGDRTELREYMTQEQYGNDWIIAGSGTITGTPLQSADLMTIMINYCFISEIYSPGIFLIPYVFGLKTGSY